MDQLTRYCRWYRKGYLSSTGRCFDIGNATRTALKRFEQTRDPFSGLADPFAAGNGSLMRLAPIPLFFVGQPEVALAKAAESSQTTHGAKEATDACRYFASLMLRALQRYRENRLLRPLPYTPGKPFVWTKTADEILASIARFANRTLALPSAR